jgi:hypothetical protein
VLGGRALDVGALGREVDDRIDAVAAQHARGDVAVTAVVTGAADDGDRTADLVEHVDRRFGDGAARGLHQRERGDAELVHRRAIELAHLGGSDDRLHARASMLRTSP